MPIVLTDEMKVHLANALNDNFPALIASIDEDGMPWQSFYGSLHVYDEQSIAFWIRDPNSRMMQRILHNGHLSILYRNSKEKIIWQFHGNAKIIDNEHVSEVIYNGIHPGEQAKDPDKLGAAVLVEISIVLQGSKVIMEL